MSRTMDRTARDQPESANAEIGVPGRKPALKVWEFVVPAKIGAEVPVNDRFGGTDDKGNRVGIVMRMPAGARILSAQRDVAAMSVKIFALCNSDELAWEERYFYVAPTNHPLPSPEPTHKALEYLTSWHAWGKFWHLFEVTR